ncbi:MAG: hypothetical protein AB7S26_29760 [Sandaracinaceae bacterium]
MLATIVIVWGVGCDDAPSWPQALHDAHVNWGYAAAVEDNPSTLLHDAFEERICGELTIPVVQSIDGGRRTRVELRFRMLQRSGNGDGAFLLSAHDRAGNEMEVNCGRGHYTGSIAAAGLFMTADDAFLSAVNLGSTVDAAPLGQASCTIEASTADLAEVVFSAEDRTPREFVQEMVNADYGHPCPGPHRRIVLLGVGGLTSVD